jgi:hypothetical protein
MWALFRICNLQKTLDAQNAETSRSAVRPHTIHTPLFLRLIQSPLPDPLKVWEHPADTWKAVFSYTRVGAGQSTAHDIHMR